MQHESSNKNPFACLRALTFFSFFFFLGTHLPWIPVIDFSKAYHKTFSISLREIFRFLLWPSSFISSGQKSSWAMSSCLNKNEQLNQTEGKTLPQNTAFANVRGPEGIQS